MAHILVYAQRTPQGIHPASATALCLARDIASDRGATITAVCPGDAGRADQFVIGAVSRYGADLLAFCGPAGLRPLQDRLRPLVVFVPHTEEGLAAAEGLAGGPLETTWLMDPSIEWDNLAAVTSIVAGTLPWYDLPTIIDAEYDNEASHVELPQWVQKLDASYGRGPLRFFAPPDLDPGLRAALTALGAKQIGPEYIEHHESGTLLWLGGTPPPEALRDRTVGARVMYFPGPGAVADTGWTIADWVLPGPWQDAVKDLHSDLWKPALA
ncbi:MAG: hypothetical protein JNL82_17785 [Myxococcales bacterium]|nr:hypothetical protein [Myxococcales bacterium]